MLSVSPRSAAFLVLAFAWTLLGGGAIAQDEHPAQKLKKLFEEYYAKNDFNNLKDLVNKNRDDSVTAGSIYEFEYCTAAVKDDKATMAKLGELYEQLGLTYKISFDDSLLYDRKNWVVGLEPEAMQRRIDIYFQYADNFAAYDAARKAGGDEPFRDVVAKLAETYKLCISIKDYFYAAHTAHQSIESYTFLNDQFAQAYWAKKGMNEAMIPGSLQKYFAAHFTQRLEQLGEKEVKKPELINIELSVEDARAKYQADYAASLVVTDDSGKTGKPSAVNSGGVVLVPPKSKDAPEWVDDEAIKSVPGVDPLKKPSPYFNVAQQNRGAHDTTSFPFVVGRQIEKGQTDLEFTALPNGRISFEKDLLLDPDGPNGKQKPIELKLKSKPEPVKFNVEFEDGSKALMTHWMYLQPSSFKFNGFDFENRNANSKTIRWYGTSAVKGTVRGHTVMVIDSNGDGTFLSTGFDTVIVDPDTPKERIEPLGRYIYFETGEGLYPYEMKVVQGNGCKIRTRPYQGDLAALRVEWTGKAKPKYLVAVGAGEDSAFYLDLMKAVDKVVWVPPSAYSISHGYYRENPNTMKERYYLIGKGRSGQFKVEAGGKVNVWQLGGSGEKGFWMLCDAARSDDDVNALELDGKSLRVYGNFGEEYFAFLEERVLPTVEIRKDSATGNKIKGDTMKAPTQTGLNETTSFLPGPLKIKNVPKGKIVYRLIAEHSLIGKIESDWIEIAN